MAKRYNKNDGYYKGVYVHEAKDGSKTWYVKYDGRDKEKVPGVNLTAEDAVAYRHAMKNKSFDTVVANRSGRNAPIAPTLKEGYEIWKAWAELHLSSTTYKPMISRWNKYLEKSLGHIRLDLLDEVIVRNQVHKWSRQGLAPGTCKRLTSIISAIYNAINEAGLNYQNPIFGMKVAGAKAKRDRILSREEAEALLLGFKRTRYNYYLMMGLAWYGGMRPIEIRNMRIADIKADHIYIPNVKTPTGQFKSRKVWFDHSPKLKQIVEEIKGYSVLRTFPKHLDYDYINGIIDSLGLNEGIDPMDRQRRVTPYTLRHSFASEMLSSGASLTEVQGALGHDKSETTLTYLHPEEDAAREGMRKLNNVNRETLNLRVVEGGK
jgi:integrase